MPRMLSHTQIVDRYGIMGNCPYFLFTINFGKSKFSLTYNETLICERAISLKKYWAIWPYYFCGCVLYTFRR